jgi:hypothetical protein
MGTIPPGPPARAVALAFIGATEGAVIERSRPAPHDEALAARAAAGVLGLNQDTIRWASRQKGIHASVPQRNRDR